MVTKNNICNCFICFLGVTVPAGGCLTSPRKPRLQDVLSSTASVSIPTFAFGQIVFSHRTLFLWTKCVRYDQVGQMTMTCAWLTPNSTTTRSFTPSRPREMCLRFSTNFTVRARFAHSIDEMFFTNIC